MPIYFFDTDDGQNQFHDDLGLDLADDQAARDEASRALGELAKEYIPSSRHPQGNVTMWVRNADGTPLLQLALTFAVKPLT